MDLVTESVFRLVGELANFIQNLMSSEGQRQGLSSAFWLFYSAVVEFRYQGLAQW